MNISIMGMGYVGCISAGCLSSLGHRIIGVDVSSSKVSLLNQGKPTIYEPGIEELIRNSFQKGLISATGQAVEAVLQSDVTFISVGTPGTRSGFLNHELIYHVAEQIALGIKIKNTFHVIAIRSTVMPGTNQKLGEIVETISGKKRNVDFSVVNNPEFLREGSAVSDFFNPPYTLVGTDCVRAREMMEEVYRDIPGEKIFSEINVAEIMKFVNNTFHALKVTFGNEIGNICKALDIDSHKVMEIFCRDRQLNISPSYLMPGFAYGGSCLPKDSRALRTIALERYLEVPVISNIDRSNQLQIENSISLIESSGRQKIGILGLSFKEGTDDLRNSAIVDVVERLIGRGYQLKIYDKNVKLSELIGTNKEYVESKIPHLQKIIFNDLEHVVMESEVIVIANREPEFRSVLESSKEKFIIDLVRLWKDVPAGFQFYEGLSWGGIK